MTHPDTLQIPRAVVEQALKKHETNCCMFERGVQTLDDVLASRATFLAALQPQADTSVLQAAPWPPAGETLTEPEAMRYDFDGYGWKYIDNGSGSDWMTRHPEGEFLFTKPQALQPQATVEPHTFNDESPFCVKCGSTGEDSVQPVAHILPRMLKILKFKSMPVPVDPLPYDNGEEKTVPLYITPPATQAALTAALEALIVMRDYYAPDGVPGIVDAAIAQIEALKGPQ